MKNVLLLLFILFFIAGSRVEAANTHSLELERDLFQSARLLDSNSDIDFTNDFTIEAWVKIKTAPQPYDDYAIVTQWSELSRGFIFSYSNVLGTKKLRLEIQDGNGGSKVNRTVSYDLLENTWQHIAVTFDSSEGSAQFYVNGDLAGVVYGLPNHPNESVAEIIVGHDANNGTRSSFDGLIDEVRVWKTVRTESEIRNNMQRRVSADNNLQASWLFDGDFNNDVSLNNNLYGYNNPTFNDDTPFADFSGIDYPLYTQIESPYPSVEETSGWEDDVYAYGSDEWCGDTVGGCGCVITSLVMAGRNAGIETDVVNGDVNPKNINAYLQSVNGYTSNGSVRWLAASAYLGELVEGGKLASRFASAPNRPLSVSDTMNLIDTSLEEGDNAVLAQKEGHFVWLPEKTDASYMVRDPFWYETETANDASGELHVRDYDNEFTDARVIKIHTEPVEFSGTDIEAHLLSETAELLFKNLVGEVGYVDGGVIVDLERASYGNTEIISIDGLPADASKGKHLLVYEAGEEFTLEVVGTGVGEFSLEFFTINEYGEVTTFEFSGLTLPGLTTVFTFNLEDGTVTEQPIGYDDFLNLLEQELSGYTLQQQKFFKKWADKIFENAETKTSSQLLQSIDVFKKLLGAKKIDSDVLYDSIDLVVGETISL